MGTFIIESKYYIIDLYSLHVFILNSNFQNS